jgi:NAD(P)H-hydrate epimerase
MKIFTVEQIRRLDEFTIENEPVASIDLMERAARAFTDWYVEKFQDSDRKVYVFCGPGNNGGDGLAIARLLHWMFYEVTVYPLLIGNNTSEDFDKNLGRLKWERACTVVEIETEAPLPSLLPGSMVIDAIFGSGLSRPVEGYWARFIEYLNASPVTRVSVDIPSGMFADKPTTGACIHADYTFSFEMPKLGFLFPENQNYVGEWTFGSIELHPGFIGKEPTPWFFTEKTSVSHLVKKRKKHDHKGTYGHALLVMGSYGKLGAAVLAARACLRSGVGLLTLCVPRCGYQVLQTVVPEAMIFTSDDDHAITTLGEDLSKYEAIGAGCGIGTAGQTVAALEALLELAGKPLVLDADALNIMAAHPHLLKKIPPGSILTPHPKEFERLFGATSDSFSRNALQRQKAQELNIYLVLKGAYTSISCPDGTCHFNSTGNPGMATGGSGDVLTGLLTGLLAQGYSPFETCILGIYLHGLAGDLAATQLGEEAMLASDVVRFITKAFKWLEL